METDARKNWDLFYKRNETKFFKDRHWTTREFQELIGSNKNPGIVEYLYNLELVSFIYTFDFKVLLLISSIDAS